MHTIVIKDKDTQVVINVEKLSYLEYPRYESSCKLWLVAFIIDGIKHSSVFKDKDSAFSIHQDIILAMKDIEHAGITPRTSSANIDWYPTITHMATRMGDVNFAANRNDL